MNVCERVFVLWLDSVFICVCVCVCARLFARVCGVGEFWGKGGRVCVVVCVCVWMCVWMCVCVGMCVREDMLM
jgi:hypothetical protein